MATLGQRGYSRTPSRERRTASVVVLDRRSTLENPGLRLVRQVDPGSFGGTRAKCRRRRAARFRSSRRAGRSIRRTTVRSPARASAIRGVPFHRHTSTSGCRTAFRRCMESACGLRAWRHSSSWKRRYRAGELPGGTRRIRALNGLVVQRSALVSEERVVVRRSLTPPTNRFGSYDVCAVERDTFPPPPPLLSARSRPRRPAASRRIFSR